MNPAPARGRGYGRGGRGRGRGGGGHPSKPRPNHFLAIRLTAPTVIEKINELQKNVSVACPRLEPLMIRSAQLHITLQVLALDTADAVKQAADLLHAARPILDCFYKEEAIQLNFTRVRHFNNRVLWLEAEEDDAKLRLKRLIRDLQSHFHSITKERPDPHFIPHLTIMKGRQQSDLMPEGLAEKFLNTICGKAEFKAVHLYRMKHPHEADGGYGCITTLAIGGGAAPPPVILFTPVTEAEEDSDDEPAP